MAVGAARYFQTPLDDDPGSVGLGHGVVNVLMSVPCQRSHNLLICRPKIRFVVGIWLPLAGTNETVCLAPQIILKLLNPSGHRHDGSGIDATIGQLAGQPKVVPHPAHKHHHIGPGILQFIQRRREIVCGCLEFGVDHGPESQVLCRFSQSGAHRLGEFTGGSPDQSDGGG